MKTKLIKYDSFGNFIAEEEIETSDITEPKHEPTVEEKLAEMQEVLDFLLMQ